MVLRRKRNPLFTIAALAVGVAVILSGCAAEEDVEASGSPSPSPTVSPSPSPTPSPSPSPTPSPTEEQEPEPTQDDTDGRPQASNPRGYDIDTPSSITVVVSKTRPLLDVEYEPETVPSTVHSVNGQPLHPDANEALAAMNRDVTAATGTGFVLCSGYRSYWYQHDVYNNFVNSHGQEAADRTSARPGHSEHQLGLAADIMGEGQGCALGDAYTNTASGQWVNENAWQYGFILRYPDGLQGIVGYHYEPWHWRYVGEDVARDMHEGGYDTLEEYFGLPNAPDYL